jgi:hypothetical protein
LDFEVLEFEVVMAGSLFDASPLLAGAMQSKVKQIAPRAEFVRLTVPPVAGGVLLGMQQRGIQVPAIREVLLDSTRQLLQDPQIGPVRP